MKEIEKILLIYIVFRNEFKIQCKNDFKLPSEEQIHQYAFDKLIVNKTI